MTATTPNEARPATEAGRALLDTLNRFRDWSADPNVKQVLVDMDPCIAAIESEARQRADMTQASALADAIEAWESASGDWSQVKVRIATIRRLTSEGEPR